MNFGFSGPMRERRVEVVKVRDEYEGVEKRVREPNELLGNCGGIAACDLPITSQEVVLTEVRKVQA
jgi:hypothetical protein